MIGVQFARVNFQGYDSFRSLHCCFVYSYFVLFYFCSVYFVLKNSRYRVDFWRGSIVEPQTLLRMFGHCWWVIRHHRSDQTSVWLHPQRPRPTVFEREGPVCPAVGSVRCLSSLHNKPTYPACQERVLHIWRGDHEARMSGQEYLLHRQVSEARAL